MTTSSGLYRYDINDIVEVRGFYQRAPRLAFVRKGRDMVSLTGEKLHSRQVGQAAELAGCELGLVDLQVQLIPDHDKVRYDLLVECEGGIGGAEQEFAAAFDRHLAEINIEYAQKRRSRRLGPPPAMRHEARVGMAAPPPGRRRIGKAGRAVQVADDSAAMGRCNPRRDRHRMSVSTAPTLRRATRDS